MKLRAQWPVLVGIALGLSQPIVHYAIQHFPPPGAVHSGMSIPDSVILLECMRMFESGLAAAYAPGEAAPTAGVAYYSLPHHWLYGLLGAMADCLGISHFSFLGIANGCALTFYLLMCWRFLRRAVPELAAPAFALFALTSGPGGILWMLAQAAGWHTQPAFETWFFRWIVYDLTEGPYFHPLLIGPRAYYTLSLGVLLGALSAAPFERERQALFWLPMVTLAAFLYARAGAVSVLLAVLMFSSQGSAGWRSLAGFALAAMPGIAASGALMQTNPAVIENHRHLANHAMWISPALIALSLHLPLIIPALCRAMRAMPAWQRHAAAAAAGYIAAYILLYVARGIYLGTLAHGRDGAVAAAVSDPALAGAVVGALWSLKRGAPTQAAPVAMPAWIALWVLCCFAIAISGFGQGRFLQFGPQRVQLFLWLPLCVLAAASLTQWRGRIRRAAWGILLTAGFSSLAVALVVFQAGAGRNDARGPFPYLFAQWITPAEAEALQRCGGSTILAPAPLADAAVVLHGAHTPFGIGSFNLAKTPMAARQREVAAFLDPATPSDNRRAMAVQWGLDYVLLSAARGSQEIAAQVLAREPWAEQIPGAPGLWLFRIAAHADEKKSR
jgi:hypothetical protein